MGAPAILDPGSYSRIPKCQTSVSPAVNLTHHSDVWIRDGWKRAKAGLLLEIALLSHQPGSTHSSENISFSISRKLAGWKQFKSLQWVGKDMKLLSKQALFLPAAWSLPRDGGLLSPLCSFSVSLPLSWLNFPLSYHFFPSCFISQPFSSHIFSSMSQYSVTLQSVRIRDRHPHIPSILGWRVLGRYERISHPFCMCLFF